MERLDVYRDPRTALGGAASASRPRIPVGEVIEGPPQPTQAPKPVAAPAAAAPVAPQGNGAMPAPAAAPQPGRTAGVRAATTKAIGSAASLSTPSPGLAAAGAISGAADALNTPTENYYRRLQLDPTGANQNGFKDLAVRSIGALSDVGAGILDIPMGAVNGVRKFAGAEALPTFREVLTRDDGPVPQQGIGSLPASQTAPQAAAAPATSASLTTNPVPTAPTPSPAGITFDPRTKTYSNVSGPSAPAVAGGRGGGTVTSLPTSGFDGYTQQLDRMRSIGDMPSQSVGDGGSTVGQGPIGINGGRLGDQLRGITDTITPKDAARIASRQGRSAATAAVQTQQQQQQAEAGARTAEVAARGQDIGAANSRAENASRRDIAVLQGRTARDVATIGAEGRAEAAAARGSSGPRYTPIQLPDEVSADGMTTRRMGTALLNNDTGEIVYPGQGTGKPKISEADAMSQAKAAVSAGADKAAVNKRLAELGFKPI